MKPEHGKKWMPAMYVAYYGIIEAIANKHGYALCIHGSVNRDFDLIAVPFDEVIGTHEEVVSEISNKVGIDIENMHLGRFQMKGYEPHGRVCYCIECGAGGYFDISFTPTLKDAVAYVKRGEQMQSEVIELLKQTS